MSYVRGITTIVYLYFLGWVLFNLGFIYGYEDAESDLSKKGYNFEEVPRAFYDKRR